MTFRTLDDLDFKSKIVLLRLDLNVPTIEGKITDTSRIDRAKPTIEYLKDKGAKTVILSHFGRPKGEVIKEYSLNFLPTALKKQWGFDVGFANDCIGSPAKQAIESMEDGDILLLENVRFHKGETNNDPEFVKALAELGDIYVQDAFSAAHRAHASTEGLAHHLPCAAGLLMEAELNALEATLNSPTRPVIAVVGGAKISTKLSVLKNLVKKTDHLVLGGGMANTFLFANDVTIGNSLCEKDMISEAKEVMDLAKKHDCEIILPEDQVVVRELKENAEHEIVDLGKIANDQMAIDIGPKTISKIKNIIQNSKTILWNGPMGVFEVKPFDNGTNEVAQEVGRQTQKGNISSVAGGGDTLAALENANASNQFSYISTAGGAFLEWLEGKILPGVAALMKKEKAA